MVTNNIAIITGAGSGLGRELSICLAGKGWFVVLVGRRNEQLEETANLAGKDKALVVCADISSEAEVDGVFNKTISWKGIPNLVISCAGEGLFKPVGEYSEGQIQKILSANLIGLILVSQKAFKEMRNTGGHIVNIMSTAAFTPRVEETVYCAAKAGAKGFSEALRLEAKDSAVKVICVYPGGMKTPFWSKDCGRNPNTESFMDPKEVAEVVITNLSKKSLVVSDLIINRK